MITGVLGNIIVTSHLDNHLMLLAMWIWFTSNIAWAIYALKIRAWHPLTLQASYLILNI